jgi:membrane protein DedA with SNARE-associated domain
MNEPGTFLAGAIRRYVGYVVGTSRYRYRIFELISTISAVPGVVEGRLGYLSATLHPSRSPVRLP